MLELLEIILNKNYLILLVILKNNLFIFIFYQNITKLSYFIRYTDKIILDL